jgi:hypothetical protein
LLTGFCFSFSFRELEALVAGGGKEVDEMRARIMQMKAAEAAGARQAQERRAAEDFAAHDAYIEASTRLQESQQQVCWFCSSPPVLSAHCMIAG